MSSSHSTPPASPPATAADKASTGELHAAGTPPSPTIRPPQRRKWPWIAGLVLLAIAAIFIVPWVREALSTVSTDDAYVNGHVTFVAPVSMDRSKPSWSTTTMSYTRATYSSSLTLSPTRCK